MLLNIHRRVLPGWARLLLVLTISICGVTAWPQPAGALVQCCTLDIMCGCGELQCCPHEDLGALACSVDDQDYCRYACDDGDLD